MPQAQLTRYRYGGKLHDISLSLLLDSVVDAEGRVSSFAYNLQQERVTFRDPNGTVHDYGYDQLGRVFRDSVSPGRGIDAQVREIGFTYNAQGMLERITSYSQPQGAPAVAIVNQVQREYDQFGQVVTEAQWHFAPTAGGRTDKTVQYKYSVGRERQVPPTIVQPRFAAEHAPRLVKITYPQSAAAVHYVFGDHQSSYALGRVARIDAQVRGGGEQHLTKAPRRTVARYTYFGAQDMYRLAYPETGDLLVGGQPLAFDMAGGLHPRDTSGDSSYAALDRFDRLVAINWGQRNYGFVDRLAWWHDRLGNRLARRNRPYIPFNLGQANQPLTLTHDERYVYDGLYRLRDMQRGSLPDGFAPDPSTPLVIANRQFEQNWDLDLHDNWRHFAEDADGDGITDQLQTRLHDRTNRIDTVSNQSIGNVVTHDAAGNLTEFPRLPAFDKQVRCTYDAWNRLVRVAYGGTTVAEYEYDGLGRRIIKRTFSEQSGALLETRHFHYSLDWQEQPAQRTNR